MNYLKFVLFGTLLGVACFSSSAFAQTKVALISTAPDSIGVRLVYALKEGIRKSAGMQLVDSSEDALITVRIVTIDPDDSSTQNRTIYSVVWTARTFHQTPVDMYLTNSVGTCGTNRVSQCADGLAAYTDAQATTVKGWLKAALEKK